MYVLDNKIKDASDLCSNMCYDTEGGVEMAFDVRATFRCHSHV